MFYLTVCVPRLLASIAKRRSSDLVPVTFTVTNIGASTAQPGWYDMCYLSADAAHDPTDLGLGHRQQGATLAAGASYTATVTCTTHPSTAPGAYRVFVKTDGYWAGD